MLVELHIVNFAIIEAVELCLGPGLNVLTGETGAGKSIIVGAAGLLRGGRASAEMVRTGCDEAVVEAVFDLSGCPRVRSQLEEAGLPASDHELLVRRIVSRNGRGRIYVNGALCTAAVLAQVTGQLLDISGQHEHQMLSDSATHRRLLDALGTPPGDLERMEQLHREVRETARLLASRRMSEQQRTAQIDFLRFQLAELEAAALRPSEDTELEQERVRLARAAELLEAAATSEQELYSGDGAVVERLARLSQRLGTLVRADPALEPYAAQLEEARVLLEDVGLSLGRYASRVELDPERLAAVEERLELVQRLCRKHGGSLAEALAHTQAMQRELGELESLDVHFGALEAQLGQARQQAEEVAARISAARRRTAQVLAREVAKELEALRMPGARLTAELTPLAPREGDESALCFGARRIGPAGWDHLEFCIAANPGEEARPLRRIASGGELSRIMLALRKVLGVNDPVATSTYDEVDAGVGGAVADVVGRSLAQTARHRQVLCVTHLPQVAAYADRHFFVDKATRQRRTRALVRLLDAEERVEELARMLGGAKVSTQARDNARQLLRAAQHLASTIS